jgi:hypothetical protein
MIVLRCPMFANRSVRFRNAMSARPLELECVGAMTKRLAG